MAAITGVPGPAQALPKVNAEGGEKKGEIAKTDAIFQQIDFDLAPTPPHSPPINPQVLEPVVSSSTPLPPMSEPPAPFVSHEPIAQPPASVAPAQPISLEESDSEEEDDVAPVPQNNGWTNPLPFGPKTFTTTQVVIVTAVTLAIIAGTVFVIRYYRKPNFAEKIRPLTKPPSTAIASTPSTPANAQKRLIESSTPTNTEEKTAQEKQAASITKITQQDLAPLELPRNPPAEQMLAPPAVPPPPSYKYSWSDYAKSFEKAMIREN